MNRKDTIKLLKKILLFFIPVYMIWFFYIEFFPVYYNRPTNTRWYFLKSVLEGKEKIPESNKIFLGESRLNAGLDYTKIPDSYGFASGGSSPVEMYYVLEKYLKKYTKPDTVFFSVSPRFFCETFAFWHYAVRNNFISHKNFKEIISEKNKKDTVLGNFEKLRFLLYKSNYIGYYQDDVLYSYVFNSYSKNKKLISEMKKMKGGRPHPGLKDSCSSLNYETKYEHFLPSPLLFRYFEKTADLCKKNKIKFIFFSMPMNESSFKALNPDFVSEYQNTIQKFADKYPDFEISSDLYFYKNKFFGDDSHLNKKGKEKFTEYFISKYF